MKRPKISIQTENNEADFLERIFSYGELINESCRHLFWKQKILPKDYTWILRRTFFLHQCVKRWILPKSQHSQPSDQMSAILYLFVSCIYCEVCCSPIGNYFHFLRYFLFTRCEDEKKKTRVYENQRALATVSLKHSSVNRVWVSCIYLYQNVYIFLSVSNNVDFI